MEDKGRSKAAKGSEHMLVHRYTHTLAHTHKHIKIASLLSVYFVKRKL